MLTQAQIDSYRTNGYLGVENVLSAQEVAELRRVTDEFVEKSRHVTEHTDVFDLEPDHTPEAPRLRRIKDPGAHHSVYDHVCRHEGIVDIVAQLVGPNVRLSASKLNMKSAGFGSAVEWHQDWAFQPHQRRLFDRRGDHRRHDHPEWGIDGGTRLSSRTHL